MAEKKTKNTKFNWDKVQNTTAASILTGITTPFLLAPFDIAEVTQNTKPLSHLPKNTPITTIYKELFTNPQVLKQVYTKSVPVRLIKNIPAQAATLGSFSLYKELLDYYNPPMKKHAFVGLITKSVPMAWRGLKSLGEASWMGAKYLGTGLSRIAKNKDFWNTFINIPHPDAKFLTKGGLTGIGVNFGYRIGVGSVEPSKPILKQTFQKPHQFKITGLNPSGTLTTQTIK